MTEIEYKNTIELLKTIIVSWGKPENVFLVGGAVRDLLLGREIKDLDLCISSKNGVEEFIDYLKDSWSSVTSGFVVYPRFGTAKFSLLVNERLMDIECVVPRTETYNSGPRKPDQVKYASIQEDSKRRDFCCNALYMNIVSGEILDPTGHGVEDVKNKILRTPIDSKETFIDDPLRMLRAFRFAYQKGFSILPAVLEKIRPYPEYYKLSKERINDEFTKMILSYNPAGAVVDLHNSGLLENIVPELEEGWNFNQNSKYHSMTLSEHSLSVLTISSRSSSCLEVRLAALLHDISKYKYHDIEEDGHFSYHQHELKSADMAEEILRRLHYSNQTIDRVKDLIKNHMRIKSLYDYDSDTYTGSKKTTRKIDRECGGFLEGLMILIDADNRSHSPEYNMPGQVESFWNSWKSLNLTEEHQSIQPVGGKEIMERLGISEGKEVGYIKDIFQDWYDSDPSLTPEQLFERYRKEIKVG